MLAVTNKISEDEPVWGLAERNLPAPDSKSIHRYQIITVRRGESVAQFTEDMGLAKKFKKGEFRVQSFWHETVGEARDIADYLRNQTHDWRDSIIPIDMVNEYLIQQEMRKLKAVGHKTYGYEG